MKLMYRHLFVLCLLMFVAFNTAFATHYRAGEILYELIGNYKYRVTVITYSKFDGISMAADKDQIDIMWGDGQSAIGVGRANGIDANGNGFRDGELIATSPINIKKSVYIAEHTYPGAPPPPNRFYVIQFMDLNRIDGINNIENGNSIEVPFYVEDTLMFPTDLANIGFNSSPILACPPIDYANLNDTFFHNPCAYDPDGDSLDFKLIPCKEGPGTNVPVYTYPDQYCQSAGFPSNTFTIDKHTGQVTWATPCRLGIYNIAILVTEYRNGVKLGTLIRDMQIIVLSLPNDPPQIVPPRDTCVRAGDILNIRVYASDPNITQTVTMAADGGPFYAASSPATFTQFGVPANPTSGEFVWNTNCSHIEGQDYTVVFRAADSYAQPGNPPSPTPLVDIETWQIKVIAPPPLNLAASATNQGVTLTWQNPYNCASSPDFRGFSVWRKDGCDLFDPEYCETGLAGRGFTKLTGANIFTYTYFDNATVVGQQYTYRVVAHFSKLSPNGLFQFNPNESVPSNGICVFMPIDIPAIINVDVKQTDLTNGQIFVRWTKPLAGGNNLDTIQNPPPYRFDLYRGTGYNLTNPVRILSTPDATSFSALIDTFYTDAGLDTKTGPWSYKVLFFSNNDTVGASAQASSVFLDVEPSDQSLYLSWSEQVPWSNDSFAIYKLNKTTALYEAIDTTYNHFYTDSNLINDSTYCYYVRSYGHYALPVFPRPLVNNSQEDCGTPIDTVPPCPPVLTIRNECDQYNGQPWNTNQYINYLTWSLQKDSCSEETTHYYIYFGDDSAGMRIIDSITNKTDTLYNHVRNESLAGCYAVTALDRVGNESALSNVVCIDNCPYYVLPNSFTPNGDGANEKFTPFKPYRFVPKIEMHIYNRWGEEVYYTEDPDINWDGKDQKGKEVSEGVYVYAGYYYELRQSGLVKRPLSGEKKGGGFIHLIRGK
jgi:gliding motility-associated-like protein